MKGLYFPSLAEQLEPSLIGDSNKGDSQIAKSLYDTAKFLADQGELRIQDLPKSYSPFIDSNFVKKALARE
jgi:ABC-type taurine transport system substrate-binding protein